MLRACVSAFALVGLSLVLLATAKTAAAESGDNVTTELQPGWNLAGWTEESADIQAVFDAIPRLEAVYAWDAEHQRFSLAFRTDSGLLGDMETLTPGMGLWLLLGGDEPLTWTRPLSPRAGQVSLHEGWNLVVWAGEEGVVTTDALQHVDDIVSATLDGEGREPATLSKGAGFWLEASASKQWWQFTLPLTIEFLSDHTPEQQAQARALVDDVVTYFGRRFGLAVPGLLVQIGNDDFLTASGACGYFAAGAVPKVAISTEVLTNPEWCPLALAHEYVHGIQDVLRTRGGELAAAFFHEPFWLREGVANHWAAQAVEATGGGTYDDHFREAVLHFSRFFPSSLQRMDDYGRYNYELSQLAVHRLASLAGEQALFDFYARHSEHQTWEEAFHATFGMTTDAFYEDFASYRAEVAPRKADFNVVVLGPSGDPLEGITIRIRRVSDGGTWLALTNAEGSFSFLRADAGSYDLAFSAGGCPVPWTSDSSKVTMTGAHTARLELAPGDVEDFVAVLTIPLSEACP